MKILKELREITRLLKLLLKQGAVEDQASKAALVKEGENGS